MENERSETERLKNIDAKKRPQVDVSKYGNTDEQEVLFPRNTNFMITGTDMIKNIPVIYLEEKHDKRK